MATRYEQQLGLEPKRFGEKSLDDAYGLVVEILANRHAGQRLNDFKTRKGPPSLSVLQLYAGPELPAPAADPAEGEIPAWLEWLAALPTLSSSSKALLAYLEAVARVVDREAFDTADTKAVLRWAQVRDGSINPQPSLPRNAVLTIAAPGRGRSAKRRTLLTVPVAVDPLSGELAFRSDGHVHCFRDALVDSEGNPLLPFDEAAIDVLEGDMTLMAWPEVAGELERRWIAAFGHPWHETRLESGGSARLVSHLLDAKAVRPSGLVKAYAELSARPIPPLLQKALEGVDQPKWIKQFHSTGFVGHMDDTDGAGRCAFALDPSQRVAVVAATAAASGEAGDIIPINGPPGTGKTRVLRAIIASVWVQDALAERDCPRSIWGTGSTNKSVRNIIDAFATVAGPEGSGLYERWISGLPSYGWFAPSGGEAPRSLHLMQLRFDKGDVTADGAAALFQQMRLGGADAVAALYAERASAALGAAFTSEDQVVAALHARLVSARNSIAAAERDFANGLANLRAAAAGGMVSRYRLARAQRAVMGAQASRDETAAALAAAEALRAPLAEWRRADAAFRRRWHQRVPHKLRELFGLGDAERGELQSKHERAIASARTLSLAADLDPALEAALAAATEKVEAARRAYDEHQALLSGAERELASLLARRQAQDERIKEWLAITRGAALPRRELFALRDPERVARAPLAWWLELQAALDRDVRFAMFHTAARYWEGRYIARWRAAEASPSSARQMTGLDSWFMLAPILVLTTKRYLGLVRYGAPTLMIMDETGQCPSLEGIALLAQARMAVLVGDVEQLAPVHPIGDASDRAVALRAGAKGGRIPDAVSASRGSMMRVAQRAAAVHDGGPYPGVTLRYHYRCAPDIIGYCNRLSYNGLIRPVKRADPPGSEYYRRRMTWVDVQGTPDRVGTSWVNRAEAEEIARWLAASHQDLVERYEKPLSQVVGILSPMSEQVAKLRSAIKTALAGSVDQSEIDALVIGTVHALQGDEREVVAFSLVQKTAAGSGAPFAERGGPNLMNVAVSRAKSEFIVFGDRHTIKPTPRDGQVNAATPIGLLGAHLRGVGSRRYPRQLVVIEAPGKRARLQKVLGLDALIVATGGTVQSLERIDADGAWHWSEPSAELLGRLQHGEDLPELVIATDDDLAGELIGWQVAKLAGDGRQRISRMRFGSLEEDDLRMAYSRRGDRFDAATLRAALARLALTHEHAPAGGAGLVQRGLLELVERHARDDAFRVDVLLEQHSVVDTGFIAESDATLAQPAVFTREEAERICAGLTGSISLQWSGPAVAQRPAPYPANTTFRMLALGARDHGFAPWRTQDLLNQLYLQGANDG